MFKGVNQTKKRGPETTVRLSSIASGTLFSGWLPSQRYESTFIKIGHIAFRVVNGGAFVKVEYLDADVRDYQPLDWEIHILGPEGK